MDHDADAAFEAFLVRVRAEYRDMPGLQLTVDQAARLWAADRTTCRHALEHLVERRILRLTHTGFYTLLRD